MSFKENLQNIFNPRQVGEVEKLTKTNDARKQNERATVAYLEGKMLEKFQHSLKKTYPLTRINLRKLASQ